MTAYGELPKSTALSEAHPESLAELFSRNPEGFQDQDLDRIITELRAMRARWVQAEELGKKAPKAAKLALEGPAKTVDLSNFV